MGKYRKQKKTPLFWGNSHLPMGGILIGLPVPPGVKIEFYDHSFWAKIEGPQLGRVGLK